MAQNGFWKQVVSLVGKDLSILLIRHFTSTLYTAILLPVILTVYVGIGQNLQASGNNDYGISEITPVRSLEDALRAADSTRRNIVFVDNGVHNENIDKLINALDERITATGKVVHRVSDVLALGRICTVSFQATTPCYGGVVFNDSPGWNYTLRGDANLGTKFHYDQSDNDPQIYILPLQRAIDQEIARLEGSDISFNMQELLFTNQTDTERRDDARREYQDTFVNYMGLTILLGFYGLREQVHSLAVPLLSQTQRIT